MTRKRRQILILALVSVLLVFALWRIAWRADRRFIGEWRRVGAEHAAPEFVFRMDGSGNHTNPYPGYIGVRSGRFRWWTSGDCLVIQYVRGEKLSNARAYSDYVYSRFTGAPLPYEFNCYEILVAAEESLRLRLENQHAVLVLRRSHKPTDDGNRK
jgi:hypothetical protein